ncbi:MAG: hypothetical protein AAGJ38_09485 [Planctomycetota bacterium]
MQKMLQAVSKGIVVTLAGCVASILLCFVLVIPFAWMWGESTELFIAAGIGGLAAIAGCFVSLGIGITTAISASRPEARANVCRQCGYDLRASVNACPECGLSVVRDESLSNDGIEDRNQPNLSQKTDPNAKQDSVLVWADEA